MIKIMKSIARIGVISETSSTQPLEEEKHLTELQQAINRVFGRSMAIRHLDAGSCNACELEIQAVNNPYYNLEGYGIHFTASPRHADILLVTGPVSKNMVIALRRTYQAMPEPKFVVAVGDCATCGGLFGETYATCGSVSSVIPVDLALPGCPPTPTDLLQGILKLVNKRITSCPSR